MSRLGVLNNKTRDRKTVTQLGKLVIAKQTAHGMLKDRTRHLVALDAVYCYSSIVEFLTHRTLAPTAAKDTKGAKGASEKRLHIMDVNKSISSGQVGKNTRVLNTGALKTSKSKLKLSGDS